MAFSIGQIIDYLDGDAVVTALVLEQKGHNLQVLSAEGRRHKLPMRRVVVTHTGTATTADFSEAAAALEANIAAAEAEVDTAFLWEMVRDEGDEQGVKSLAALFYGDATPVHQSAMLRALLGDKLRFRRKGMAFTPRTPDAVAAREQAQQEREQRQALQDETLSWMRPVLKGQPLDPADRPPSMTAAQEDLEAFLRSGKRSLTSGLLSTLGNDDNANEVAFEILLRTGWLDTATDAWMLLGGIDPAFPPEALAALGRLAPYTPDPAREDLSHLPAFSIDDATTQDMDDAMTVEHRDGRLLVGIHIADPSYFVKPGDALDREALRRGLSVYLPTGPVTMFPPRLSHDLASLTPGTLRPALSFMITFTPDFEIEQWRLVCSQVRVAHKLSYDQADAMIQGDDAPPAAAVRVLNELRAVLQARRLADGALVVSQPELKVYVADGSVTLKRLDTMTPARQLVSEAMILTNALAARFAVEEELPVLYRAQAPPDDPDLVGLSMDYDPVVFRTLFRGMRPSRFTEHPSVHAGLGLPAYTQVSSPIRRYADLALQRQLLARLNGAVYPYTQTELMPVLATAEAAERASRSVEKRAVAYWALTYLKTHFKEVDLEAVVIHRAGGGFEVELTAYGIRGLLHTTEQLALGDVLNVRIKRIRPRRGDVRFKLPP